MRWADSAPVTATSANTDCHTPSAWSSCSGLLLWPRLASAQAAASKIRRLTFQNVSFLGNKSFGKRRQGSLDKEETLLHDHRSTAKTLRLTPYLRKLSSIYLDDCLLLAKLRTMDTQELIAALDYAESPNFLPASRFNEVPVFAHVFRRAERRCALQGVYLLSNELASASSATPIVYVAKAESREAADLIHRQVWKKGCRN